MVNDLLAGINEQSSALEKAAKAVLRELLDDVVVHPCDEGNDAVAVKSLSPALQDLLRALVGQDEGAQVQTPGASASELASLSQGEADRLVGQKVAGVVASEFGLSLAFQSGDVLDVRGHTYNGCALDVDFSHKASQG